MNQPTAARNPPWLEFARAPLVPFALGAAIGLAADRLSGVPLESSLGLAAISIVLAVIFRSQARLLLAAACAGLAAAHHHAYRHVFPADDIGWLAGSDPTIVRIRGYLDEQPVLRAPNTAEVLGPVRRIHRATSVLIATEIQAGSGTWQAVSGRVRLVVELDLARGDAGPLDGLTIGDEVECAGLLAAPQPPGNPGERDYRDRLLDQRIRCELRVAKDARAVVRLHDEPAWGIRRGIAQLRGRLTRLLQQSLPESDVPLARALLLGDGSATSQDDWDAFARTGVMHVLVISGQHMAVLAAAVWMALRIFGVPRRQSAWLVLALLVGYAALTGGRPPAIRAAAMVAVLCVGVVARRPVHVANAFALAWLIVVAVQPAEAASTGSMLSFLSVFVLVWGAARWLERPEPSPVGMLRAMARPAWLNVLIEAGWIVAAFYAVNAILLIVNAPLIASVQNVVPPIGLLMGPPVIFFAMLSMIFGFAVLLIGLVSPLLAAPFALITGACLSLARSIVELADSVPGGTIYVPNIPIAWLVPFYMLLVTMVLLDARWLKPLLAALLVWTILGLAVCGRGTSDELRITFLAVGHGGCTVLEAPDGRVIVYDAGTMAGPDAVRRTIAPFLWHRGIRRIDELILSHADLDHFNGVPQLLRRFPVGRCTLTPSFAEKPTPEVAEALAALARHGVPRHLAMAGDEFEAGTVRLNMLHPPRHGPAGSENERSLVMLVRHGSHTILLTGDLEKAGTTMLLAQPPIAADVLMAPHHGSPTALPAALLRWAEPKLIVACRGQRSGGLPPELGVWDTWTHGAVTIRSHAGGLTAETYRTSERRVLRFGK